MNKRLAIGLFLGMSLLFYAIMPLQKSDYYRVEARINATDETEPSQPESSPAAGEPSQPTDAPAASETPVPNGAIPIWTTHR